MPGGALEDGTSALQAGLLLGPPGTREQLSCGLWDPLMGLVAPPGSVFRKLRPEGPERQPGPGSECLTGSKGGVHCVYLCV